MITELIMTVGFIIKNSEKGNKIVGGAELCHSTSDLSWLNFDGEEILIQTSKEDMYVVVRKIDVFPSISGAINIGLTLDDAVQLDAISVGDKVFKIIKRD